MAPKSQYIRVSAKMWRVSLLEFFGQNLLRNSGEFIETKCKHIYKLSDNLFCRTVVIYLCSVILSLSLSNNGFAGVRGRQAPVFRALSKMCRMSPRTSPLIRIAPRNVSPLARFGIPRSEISGQNNFQKASKNVPEIGANPYRMGKKSVPTKIYRVKQSFAEFYRESANIYIY